MKPVSTGPGLLQRVTSLESSVKTYTGSLLRAHKPHHTKKKKKKKKQTFISKNPVIIEYNLVSYKLKLP